MVHLSSFTDALPPGPLSSFLIQTTQENPLSVHEVEALKPELMGASLLQPC